MTGPTPARRSLRHDGPPQPTAAWARMRHDVRQHLPRMRLTGNLSGSPGRFTRRESGPSVTAKNRPWVLHGALHGVLPHARAIFDAAPASVAPGRPPAGAGRAPARRKIEAMRPPRLATADARQPHPAASPQTKPADALGRIGGARRQMPALAPDQSRQAQLVGADQRHARLRRETPDTGAELGMFHRHYRADMRSEGPERQPGPSWRKRGAHACAPAWPYACRRCACLRNIGPAGAWPATYPQPGTVRRDAATLPPQTDAGGFVSIALTLPLIQAGACRLLRIFFVY